MNINDVKNITVLGTGILARKHQRAFVITVKEARRKSLKKEIIMDYEKFDKSRIRTDQQVIDFIDNLWKR